MKYFTMKKDCFAYAESAIGGGCLALIKPLCKSGECPFYKTKKQCEVENNYCEKRLKQLEKFDYYNIKYNKIYKDLERK